MIMPMYHAWFQYQIVMTSNKCDSLCTVYHLVICIENVQAIVRCAACWLPKPFNHNGQIIWSDPGRTLQFLDFSPQRSDIDFKLSRINVESRSLEAWTFEFWTFEFWWSWACSSSSTVAVFTLPYNCLTVSNTSDFTRQDLWPKKISWCGEEHWTTKSKYRPYEKLSRI